MKRTRSALFALFVTFGLFMALGFLNQTAQQSPTQMSQVMRVQTPDKGDPSPPSPPPQPRLEEALSEPLALESVALGRGMQMNFDAGLDALLALSREGKSHEAQPTLPEVLRTGEFHFPAKAQREGIRGFVRMRLRIGQLGNVADWRIIESEPEGVFDQAAMNYIKTWRFKPGKDAQGKEISMWVEQVVRYDF